MGSGPKLPHGLISRSRIRVDSLPNTLIVWRNAINNSLLAADLYHNVAGKTNHVDD